MIALLDSVETLCDEDHLSFCSLTALHWCYLMRASVACSFASPVDKEQHMVRSTFGRIPSADAVLRHAQPERPVSTKHVCSNPWQLIITCHSSLACRSCTSQLHFSATLLSYTSLPRQVLLCCSTLWRVLQARTLLEKC